MFMIKRKLVICIMLCIMAGLLTGLGLQYIPNVGVFGLASGDTLRVIVDAGHGAYA